MTIALLTNKGKYGLKAMLHLARLPEGDTAPIAEIARLNNIPKKFLDAILLDLKNAGMLRSKKGPGGGYALARPASSIMVGAVVRALEGPIAPIACASRTAFQACEDCQDLDGCAVRLVMTDVRDAMAAIIDAMSIADIARRTAVSAPDYVI